MVKVWADGTKYFPIEKCSVCGNPHDEPALPGTERWVCLLTLLVPKQIPVRS